MVFEQASVPLSLSSSLYDDFPLMLVNKPFEDLTGFASKEVIGKNLSLLHGEHTEPRAVSALSASIRDGASNEVTLTTYRKDGTLFINHLFLFPIDTRNSKDVFYVCAHNDVSDAVTVSIINSRLESLENSLFDARTVMQSYGFNILRKNAMLAHSLRNCIQKAVYLESHSNSKQGVLA